MFVIIEKYAVPEVPGSIPEVIRKLFISLYFNDAFDAEKLHNCEVIARIVKQISNKWK